MESAVSGSSFLSCTISGFDLNIFWMAEAFRAIFGGVLALKIDLQAATTFCLHFLVVVCQNSVKRAR